MSYGRLISKDIINDPAFSAMSEGAQLWTLKLLVMADDFGRGYGEPAYLASVLSPMAPMAHNEAVKRLTDIGTSGLVFFYESGDRRYCYFPHWFQIQRFNSTCHPAPTQIPNPPNPPQAYLSGCKKVCDYMLARGAHDPDDYVDITSLLSGCNDLREQGSTDY
jgi:hypothetical protein